MTCGFNSTRATAQWPSSSSRAQYYRIADLYTDEEAAASIEGYRQIEVALQKRDGDAAERAARDHILEALSVTLLNTMAFGVEDARGPVVDP